MTHYLIIEDEKHTAQRLAAMLERQIPGGKLLAVLDSVSAAVRWLNQNQHPQLAFFDIQLADGLSFNIFYPVDSRI
jgi:DNA-binding LytR/AlgR family response regulator